MRKLDDAGLDLLFRSARTPHVFLPKPVPEHLLRQIYDLAKLAPTSFNCSPLRVVFVTSAQGKERLLPALAKGNIEKARVAPVIAILAHDVRFYDWLPRLFPRVETRARFVASPETARATCVRNGTLQCAYLMLTARAVGLDVGPMSGFDSSKVDAEFFPDGRFASNFLCSIGYGDTRALPPRGPRFEFDEVCRVL